VAAVGEVKPGAPPREDKAAAGFVVGGILTLFVGAILSLFLGLAGSFGYTKISCGQAYGEGATLLVIALLFAGLAWYSVFRNKSRSFEMGFLRGIAICALVVLLVPWPCSYPATTYDHLASCER
jgi:hypothetical protein